MTSVCVHGLGYVGLPTAAALAAEGHDVLGFDIDERRIERLQTGESLPVEPALAEFVREALAGSLRVDTEPEPASIHVVCVPTPLAESDDGSEVGGTDPHADLSMVLAAGETIAGLLREGDTVVLESTVPPGTTTGPFADVLSESGLEPGADFVLAHAPETVTPGNVLTELRTNDRVIGCASADSTETVARLYEGLTDGEVRVAPSATAAEFVKLAQNTYRDVNIALANEFAQRAAELGIDARETIALANAHPRVNVHSPGPGVGGHCIPVDPWFLAAGNDGMSLVKRARHVNDGMAAYVATLTEDALGDVTDVRIGVCGIAYKPEIGDERNSSGRRVADALATAGAGPIPLHDPYVEADDVTDNLDAVIDGADAIVFTTAHAAYADLDPNRVADAMNGTVVVDAVGVLDRPAWREAGMDLRVV